MGQTSSFQDCCSSDLALSDPKAEGHPCCQIAGAGSQADLACARAGVIRAMLVIVGKGACHIEGGQGSRRACHCRRGRHHLEPCGWRIWVHRAVRADEAIHDLADACGSVAGEADAREARGHVAGAAAPPAAAGHEVHARGVVQGRRVLVQEADARGPLRAWLPLTETLLDVGVAVEVEHLGLVPQEAARERTEEHAAEVHVGLKSWRVVRNDGDVPRRRSGRALVEDPRRRVLDASEGGRHHRGVVPAVLHQLRGALGEAVAPDGVGEGGQPVPVQGQELEVQLGNGVEVRVVRHVEVLPGGASRSSLVCVQRVGTVPLLLRGVGPPAATSLRSCIAMADEARLDLRASAGRVVVAVIVIPHD
mmetsp:Transcript_70189/g.176858  ORF Transcript_70189/g.176858 Transcript_70189/m.176858 type:complete len:364 (-) Transcript_70189:48-1139(-)